MQNSNPNSEKENVYPAPRPSVAEGEGGQAGIQAPIALLILLLTFVILGLGIFLGKTFFSEKQSSNVVPTSVVSTPTAQPTADPTAASNAATANWKTYTFKDYPLSFKYPSSFVFKLVNDKMNEPSPIVTLTLNDGALIIKPQQPGLGFENPDLVITNSSISVNNVFAQKMKIYDKSNKSTSFLIIIPYPTPRDYSVMVAYNFSSGIYDQEFDKFFDQILSTFKFTTSTTGSVTKDEAVQLVKSLDEVKNYLSTVPSAIIEVDHESDDKTLWIVHVYEIKNGHTATFNWFEVNKTTKSINKTL